MLSFHGGYHTVRMLLTADIRHFSEDESRQGVVHPIKFIFYGTFQRHPRIDGWIAANFLTGRWIIINIEMIFIWWIMLQVRCRGGISFAVLWTYLITLMPIWFFSYHNSYRNCFPALILIHHPVISSISEHTFLAFLHSLITRHSSLNSSH